MHLQTLGHPIANDHCYGGELWFGDEEGKYFCKTSREWLDRLDKGEDAKSTDDNTDTECKTSIVPENSTNADTPATEAEIGRDISCCSKQTTRGRRVNTGFH